MIKKFLLSSLIFALFAGLSYTKIPLSCTAVKKKESPVEVHIMNSPANSFSTKAAIAAISAPLAPFSM